MSDGEADVGDGEADVEQATKKWGLLASDGHGTVSMRALTMESNKIGPIYEQSEAVASRQQRLQYLDHTVGVCYTNMREQLAKQCQSISSSNNVIDKQKL